LLHRRAYEGSAYDAPNYLDEAFFNNSTNPVQGFKILYHQFRGPISDECSEFIKMFRDGYKIIHMQRRNKLETYVSHRMAKKSLIWNVFINEEKVNFKTHNGKQFVSVDHCVSSYNRPIRINIEDYKMFEKKLSVWEKKIKEYFPDHLEVFYEDLPNISNVCEFLGVPDCTDLKAETIKLRKLPLEQMILNYDEIVSKL
jgi:hypothetical protein